MGYSDFQIRIFPLALRLVGKPRLARRAFGSDYPHNVGRLLIFTRSESKNCVVSLSGFLLPAAAGGRAQLSVARGSSGRVLAQFARRDAEGLAEVAVEGRETIEAPGEGDVGHRAVANWVHDRGAAFLEPTPRHVLRESRPARLEQTVQLPNRHFERRGRLFWREPRFRQMQVDMALRLFKSAETDRLLVLAGARPTSHRKEPAEIIGDEVSLAVVESVEFSRERIQIGLDNSAQAAVVPKNEAMRTL